MIYVSLRDDVPPAKVADLWYQVRKKVGDIRGSLPQGVVGPFFNDEYGDTYSLIWAFESDGFSPAEVKDIAKAVRQRLLRVPDVTKADLFGLQDEKIYIEFSHTRLAMLGVPVDQILDVVRKQNAIVASGTVETRGERVAVRVDGAPDLGRPISPPSPSAPTAARSPCRTSPRSSAATRTRSRFSMRFKGKPVIGLGVVMAAGGNVQTLGKALEADDGRDRARPAGRHHRAPRRQPARGGRQVVRGVHLLAAARRSPSCWWCRSSAWACAPASSWRSRCRWCWPSPSSPCCCSASTSSASRSAP